MIVYCFDLDDTLISEADYVVSGLRVVGRAIDSLLAVPIPEGEEGSAEWMVREWRATRSPMMFEQALARRGLEIECHRAQLVDMYRSHVPTIGWRPGVSELLTSLVGLGHRLALVSDGYLVSQRRKWEVLGGLTRLFSPVVFTDIRGREFWKPSAWGFEQVMAAHADADRFVYVGDNEEKDFIAPNRLGWVTIQVRHPDNLRPLSARSRVEGRAHFYVADVGAVIAVRP